MLRGKSKSLLQIFKYMFRHSFCRYLPTSKLFLKAMSISMFYLHSIHLNVHSLAKAYKILALCTTILLTTAILFPKYSTGFFEYRK